MWSVEWGVSLEEIIWVWWNLDLNADSAVCLLSMLQNVLLCKNKERKWMVDGSGKMCFLWVNYGIIP